VDALDEVEGDADIEFCGETASFLPPEEEPPHAVAEIATMAIPTATLEAALADFIEVPFV
jgi:hypothetical protein